MVGFEFAVKGSRNGKKQRRDFAAENGVEGKPECVLGTDQLRKEKN